MLQAIYKWCAFFVALLSPPVETPTAFLTLLHKAQRSHAAPWNKFILQIRSCFSNSSLHTDSPSPWTSHSQYIHSWFYQTLFQKKKYLSINALLPWGWASLRHNCAQEQGFTSQLCHLQSMARACMDTINLPMSQEQIPFVLSACFEVGHPLQSIDKNHINPNEKM